MSIILAKDQFMHVMNEGTDGSTFGGNPPAAAAAIATLEMIEEYNLHNKVKHIGDVLKSELCLLKDDYPDFITDVRGQGCMLGVEFKNNEIAQELKKGLFNFKSEEHENDGIGAKLTKGKILRVTPNTAWEEKEIDYFISANRSVLANIDFKKKFLQHMLKDW